MVREDGNLVNELRVPERAGPRGMIVVMDIDADVVVATAAARLHARGERVTVPRTAVIRALARMGGHVTAEEVAASLPNGLGRPHLATVYRTLERLTELGIVTHVHVGHGPTAYHLAESAHLHAQCRACSTVFDLPTEVLDTAVAEIAKIAGFALDLEQVVLAGVCANCRGQTQAD